MEAINSIIKIIFLGITGAGMPASIFIYTVWSSLKDSSKIGVSLYFGHFFAEIILLLISTFTFEYLNNSLLACFICFLNFIICVIYAVSLLIMALKNKKLKVKEENLNLDETYQDIYSLNSEENYDIQEAMINEKQTKNLSKARKKAFLVSFLLTITSLDIFRFLSLSIPSLVFQTKLNFGISNLPVTYIVFACIFILAEFILYFFLPKIIALFNRFINDKILKIITAASAIGLFICSFDQIAKILSEIKFM